ncbi:2,4-dienoyl-CoA reductase [Cryptococcus deuterogattii R265]|uniref:2,4-dienoyl-CoA reductase n=1 Tax=Cryptococcus deuterogattii (strain R265) TaxID=294750 RepID=UPI00193565ED|nr:2,4-dienoyl-CoA reductase [Cryptococcus deuterogattii R265]
MTGIGSSKSRALSMAERTAEVYQLRGQVLDGVRARAQEIKRESARLKGKVGIITGVGPESGIGAAASKLFGKEGVEHLYLLDYNDEGLPKLVSYLKEHYPGTKVTFVRGDAADHKAVSALVDRTLEEEGHLDFFFANAGISQMAKPVKGKSGNIMSFSRPLKDLQEDEFNEIMRINALGVFVAIKYASMAMAKLCPEKGKPIPGGSIVLTASIAGLKANAGPIPYSASKAAVISMAQTAAYALTGLNIRVNAVCPGLIETNMTKPLFDFARASGHDPKIGQLNPTLRQGIGHEVAQLALFLVSDESSYVNGQALAVDGGLSASVPYVRSKI